MNISPDLVRLYEEAAEEIGRLESLVSVAPPAVAELLYQTAIARLASPQATRLGCASLVSARVDFAHAAMLGDGLAQWRARVEEGERRARSGITLAVASDVDVDARAHDAVADALKPGGTPRPLLWRALQVVAWLPDAAQADLLSALLCVAGGLFDRLRLLPFASLDDDARAGASAAWRAGDVTPLTRLALPALAAEARHLRLQVRLLLDAQREEDAHLASIGRAAISARRVLDQLRRELASTALNVSESLGLSRPAASAALDRLVKLGLAEEITQRGRDRVFVYAAAWGLL